MRTALACFFICLLTSCGVTKPSAYFADLQRRDTTISNVYTADFEQKIRPGDRISVRVTSLNATEDAIFNNAPGGAAVSAEAGSSAGSTTAGYLVDPNGSIRLHRIGNITAEGLTRRQFAINVEKELKDYLREPIVAVGFLNHKVTVIGAVNRPTVIPVADEKITIIDALVQSGDLTQEARKNFVTVIREQGKDKKVKQLNLEDASVFSSPWFYLQPNDIVLVGTDTERYLKDEKRRNLQTTLSLVASGVSLLIIILDRVIR